METENQVALVTGGSSGMGKATVELFRNCGIPSMIWDRSVDPNDDNALVCDVSSSEAVERALAETIERVGVPRICVNCAGVATAQRMVGKQGVMPLNAFKAVIDVNLIGTFNVMRVVAEAMMRLPALGDSNERGIIINTASVAAYEGQIGQMAYSASKGGVVAMTLPAARELAEYGIRVNTIAPGIIETPMMLGMPQAVQDSLMSAVPFPKRFGRPAEFASLAMHLVHNTMINGEVIRLDGAIRMQPR